MNTASPEQKQSADNFFGGRSFTVLLIDDTSESIKVRQLLLSEYRAALKLIDDEIALTAFCCQPATPADAKPYDTAWAQKLQPESYEQLQDAVQEVNARGFFAFAERQTAREREDKEAMMRMLSDLPPETLKTVSELGKAGSTSSVPRP